MNVGDALAPYTLSTPTTVVTDAACRPRAPEVLDRLQRAFCLAPEEIEALGKATASVAPQALVVAWGMAALLGGATPDTQGSLERLLASMSRRDLDVVAASQRGSALDVARLVVAEAATWSGSAGVEAPGLGRIPGAAAGAAGAVVATWGDELDPAHVRALEEPWTTAVDPAPGAVERALGELWEPISRARDWVAERGAAPLSALRWRLGDWSMAMHRAAVSAWLSGRLVEQLLATVVVTVPLVGACGSDKVLLRAALPAAHARAAAAVCADVLEEDALRVLCPVVG
ncbi:hypothetical protein Q6346_04035 [Isoptericola sp. b490]|uniref:hypothetical protein n=1 Tax=Actinotalea lenta TaxID=3064654 RepID=UPI002713E76C|nr:hypothetical protein [Isoptericola sp. b490]MDO8120482.1 hypothetical protein [Isoptericola sp. b490]